jgi:hypothetical protein
MKKLAFFFSIIVLFGSGCKYFKKSSDQKLDSLVADTARNAIVDSAAYFGNMTDNSAEIASSVSSPGVSVKGKYYMIVGCFTVQTNADKYAEKLRNMGYESQIISGHNNFQMVAAKTYDNYKLSVGEIDKFRNEVTPNAWVYLERK